MDYISRDIERTGLDTLLHTFNTQNRFETLTADSLLRTVFANVDTTDVIDNDSMAAVLYLYGVLNKAKDSYKGAAQLSRCLDYYLKINNRYQALFTIHHLIHIGKIISDISFLKYFDQAYALSWDGIDRNDQILIDACLLLNKGILLNKLYSNQEAIDLLECAEYNFSKINDINGQLRAINSIGINKKAKDQFSDAENLYLDALDRIVGTDRSSKLLTLRIRINLASVYLNQHKYASGLKILKDGLDVARKYNAPGYIPYLIGNIGNAYLALGDFDQAEEAFMEVLEISSHPPKLKTLELNQYMQLNQVYSRQGDFITGNKYLDKSIELSQSIGHIQNLSGSYALKGINHYKMGLYDRALSFFKQSHEVKDDNLYTSSIYYYTGLISAINNKYYEAIEYCLKAEERVDTGALVEVLNCYFCLSENYGRIQNYKLAYAYSAKYIEANRHYSNRQKFLDVARIEVDQKLLMDSLKVLELELENLNYENILISNKRRSFTLIVILFVLAFGVAAALFVLYRRGLYNEEILRLNERLSESNEAMYDVNSKLTQSNTMLSNFAHIAAHDIKNPLISILYASKLYLDKHGDEGGRSAKVLIEKIIEKVNTMSDMMTNLLKLSIIGDPSEDLREVPLQDIIQSALENLNHVVDRVQPNIVHQYDPNINRQWPRESLHQVWLNLIYNALKYRNRDRPLKIIIGTRYAGDGDVLMYIKDNGIGIAKEHQAAIFDMYFQTDQVSAKGSGIGLFGCKVLVKKLGGKIWIESEVGVGSTFIMKFPRTAPQRI